MLNANVQALTRFAKCTQPPDVRISRTGNWPMVCWCMELISRRWIIRAATFVGTKFSRR